ncbi:hypothetical protein Q7L38_01545 [Pseudomonas protegens]|uniref:hypothetical protein n=1 Tax=Pseudomonas TaxID=286 RepID=UPI001475BCAA|nr:MULTISPECIES: hypothetical protein [Pseudomonas]MDP9531238.1 hypothetical protein [Pseudomonas protegens]NMY71182.1 hypothetical protein [Pseudomonas sp. WS 5414]
MSIQLHNMSKAPDAALFHHPQGANQKCLPALFNGSDMLRVIGEEQDIRSAINSFNSSYHEDFFRVREVSKAYLATPTPHNAELLADVLRNALLNWGAGSRKAPILHLPAEAAAGLCNPNLHAKLVRFDTHQLGAFALSSEDRRIFTTEGMYPSAVHFDAELLGVLRMLADALFANNTNVTYPMKALLLITGFMPALDSQVRNGLKHAGFRGFSSTQYLLPSDTLKAAGQKLCRLPFSLGHCWGQNKELLIKAVQKSDHPALQVEPGRVFDILLFMQQDPSRKLIAL